MSYWNHRVMRDKNGHLGIREVFYDAKGKPEMYAKDEPFGETLKELKKELRQMLEACEKPILEEW